ncbi:oogenesin-2-like [Peromyscus maniculatus bairdii]|uniref:oogenesin-2-like n=1 Tax=Peromyscus maniculatus bairdii TaxID=230844 RepID=UPI003FD009D3
MGDLAPPTLKQLARQRLLIEEDLTISILEDLPVGLLREMFEEAFNDRHTNNLRAMVSAWPYPGLSVGALIKDSDLETLKALLAGLDVLIADKVHPRRSNLRVLDLTDVDHDFWNNRAGTHEDDCSPQAEGQEQPVEISPNSAVKKSIKVVTDLELMKARCLKNPLQTLSITDCRLSQSDLDYLSQCLNIQELKHLNLSGVELSDSCPKLLGVLLERIARTLQTLELEECKMKDSHFNAILPSLSQCSQLTKVNFKNNDISLLVLKNLLRHTAKLRKLTHELYPTPPLCYQEFKLLCAELLDILRAEREPKKVSFSPLGSAFTRDSIPWRAEFFALLPR